MYGVLKFTEVSNGVAEKFETFLCFPFKGMTSFVKANRAGDDGPNLEIPDFSQPHNVRNERSAGPFPGQGQRLGGDTPPQNRQYAKFESPDIL